MNINFAVIGLTQLGIKPKSAVSEADALFTPPIELLTYNLHESKRSCVTLELVATYDGHP